MQLHHTRSWRRWPNDDCSIDEEDAEGLHANELEWMTVDHRKTEWSAVICHLPTVIDCIYLCRMRNVETPVQTGLPVMESFYTIQGEGFYQGRAAYFIRLGGCDVGCVWCDVKDSWDASAHPLVHIDEMTRRAKLSGTELVVVTGGEPLMYDLGALTKSLRNAGLKTNIETSGVYPV